MQFKYRNQFQFLSTVLALLEMAQSAMPQTGPSTKQGTGEFSFQHSNIVLTLKENNSESM